MHAFYFVAVLLMLGQQLEASAPDVVIRSMEDAVSLIRDEVPFLRGNGECLAKGEECFRSDQCCSNRCTSLTGVRWTCADENSVESVVKSDSNTCIVTDTDSCSIDSMPRDETTVVYPGGETRCISSSSSPFGFQVVPGDSDKLLVYFQGGGACWDKISTDLHFCSYDADPSSLVGIFDRNNEANNYKDYTVVQILYCSGDVHGGDVVRPYLDHKGQPVVQRGLVNAQTTLDWIKAQQDAGFISKTLSSLYIGGCSAGSIGTQLWAKTVWEMFPSEHAAIAPDSYAGVFPQEAEGPLIRGFGFCGADILPSVLKPECLRGELKIQSINLLNMHHVNDIPYTFINSKRDSTQMAFYYAIAATTNTTMGKGAHLTAAEYYDGVNQLFGAYANEPNFAAYLVDGANHCFTNKALYYDANPLSHTGSIPSKKEHMVDWVNGLVTAEVDEVPVVCAGPAKETDPNSPPDYCDESYAVE